MSEISTKPYLIRAIHEWCTDSGYRPYIAVMVDEGTQVPREFVRGGEIVLNVSVAATNRLVIGNDMIEFEARFGGVARAVSIPVSNVSAIYAQETGHGMAFDVPKPLATPGPDLPANPGVAVAPAPTQADGSTEAPVAAAARKRSRPTLVPVSATDDAGTGASAAVEPAVPEGRPARKSRSRKAPARPELVPPQPATTDAAGQSAPTEPTPRPPGGKPSLTRVK